MPCCRLGRLSLWRDLSCSRRRCGHHHAGGYREGMNEHLKEISTQVSPGAHVALVCAGAGWHHMGEQLQVPTI